MLNKLRNRAQSEKGFTLIELLVVILIIGILAAIAIPAFLGQRARAQDAGGKSAAREAQTAMETYYTDNQSYAGATPTKLQDIEQSLASAPGSTVTLTGLSASGYTLEVTAASTNKWKISKSTAGVVTRTCTKVNAKGACQPATGTTGTW
jgi:type IV pilus assembly protein PilA